MKTEQTTPARKVGIYERPARADRPRFAWVPMAIAFAVVIAWGIYVFFAP